MEEIVTGQVNELKKLFRSPRMLLAQSLNLAMIVFSALMIWKGLMFATKSESPVVVVLRSVPCLLVVFAGGGGEWGGDHPDWMCMMHEWGLDIWCRPPRWGGPCAWMDACMHDWHGCPLPSHPTHPPTHPKTHPNTHPSGSMEPAFQRGDILFLNNQDDPVRVGEIVVFKIKDRDIPIVHRVLEVHEK